MGGATAFDPFGLNPAAASEAAESAAAARQPEAQPGSSSLAPPPPRRRGGGESRPARAGPRSSPPRRRSPRPGRTSPSRKLQQQGDRARGARGGPAPAPKSGAGAAGRRPSVPPPANAASVPGSAATASTAGTSGDSGGGSTGASPSSPSRGGVVGGLRGARGRRPRSHPQSQPQSQPDQQKHGRPLHPQAEAGLTRGMTYPAQRKGKGGGGGGGGGRDRGGGDASRKTHKSDGDKAGSEPLAPPPSAKRRGPARRSKRLDRDGDTDLGFLSSGKGHQSSVLDYRREMEQLRGPSSRKGGANRGKRVGDSGSGAGGVGNWGHQSSTLDYRHNEPAGKRVGVGNIGNRGKRISDSGGGAGGVGDWGHQSSTLDYRHSEPAGKRVGVGNIGVRGHQSTALDYRHSEPAENLPDREGGRNGSRDAAFGGYNSMALELDGLPEEVSRGRSRGGKPKGQNSKDAAAAPAGHNVVALELDGLPEEASRGRKRGGKSKGRHVDDAAAASSGQDSVALELDGLPQEVTPHLKSGDGRGGGSSSGGDGDLPFGGNESMTLDLEGLPEDPPRSSRRGRRDRELDGITQDAPPHIKGGRGRGGGSSSGGDGDMPFGGNESMTLDLEGLPEDPPHASRRGRRDRGGKDQSDFGGGNSMNFDLDGLPEKAQLGLSGSGNDRNDDLVVSGHEASMALDFADEVAYLPEEPPQGSKGKGKSKGRGSEEDLGLGGNESVALDLDGLPEEPPRGRGKGSGIDLGFGGNESMAFNRFPSDEAPRSSKRGGKNQGGGGGDDLSIDEKEGSMDLDFGDELANLPNEEPRGGKDTSRGGGGDNLPTGGQDSVALELDGLPEEAPRGRRRRGKDEGGSGGDVDLVFSGHEASMALDLGDELLGLPDEEVPCRQDKGAGKSWDVGHGDSGDLDVPFDGHAASMAFGIGDELRALPQAVVGATKSGERRPQLGHQSLPVLDGRSRRRRHAPSSAVPSAIGEVSWNNVRADGRRSSQTLGRDDVLHFEPEEEEEIAAGSLSRPAGRKGSGSHVGKDVRGSTLRDDLVGFSIDGEEHSGREKRHATRRNVKQESGDSLLENGVDGAAASAPWLKNTADEDHRRSMIEKGNNSWLGDTMDKIIRHGTRGHRQDSTDQLEDKRSADKGNSRRATKKKEKKGSAGRAGKDTLSRSASHSSAMTPSKASSALASSMQQRRASAGPAPLPAHHHRVPVLYSLAQMYRWDKVETRIESHPEEVRYICPLDGLTTLHLACMSWAGYEMPPPQSDVSEHSSHSWGNKSSSSIRHVLSGFPRQIKARSMQSLHSNGSKSTLQSHDDSIVAAPCSLEVIQDLVDGFPEACLMKCRRNSYTPLAYSCLVPPIPKKDRHSKRKTAADSTAAVRNNSKRAADVAVASTDDKTDHSPQGDDRDEHSLDEKDLHPDDDEDEEPFTAADLTLDDREDLVRLLLDSNRDAASICTRTGLSPLDLHIVSYSKTRGRACADGEGIDGKTTTGVLRALLDADPTMARAGRPFTVSADDMEEGHSSGLSGGSMGTGGGARFSMERKSSYRGAASRTDSPVSPLELLYRNNAPAFLTMLAREDEIHNRRTLQTKEEQQSVVERQRSCTSSVFYPTASESVKSTLSEWWVWKWTVLLLKYGTMTRERRGTFFKAVHAAASVGGCPLPLLMLTVRAFPKQIRETAEGGNLALHIVCSWGSDKVKLSDSGNDAGAEDGANGNVLAATSNVSTADTVEASRRGMVLCALLGEYAKAAGMSNDEGRYPLSLALCTGGMWDSGIRRLVRAYPDALQIKDGPTGMYPFMIAAVGRQEAQPPPETAANGSSKDNKQEDHGGTDSFKARRRRELNEMRTVYELLRQDPRVMEKLVPRDPQRRAHRGLLTRGDRGRGLSKMSSGGGLLQGRRGMRRLDAHDKSAGAEPEGLVRGKSRGLARR